MAFTEVILTANISSLGAEADIVKVRRGYARNFLLPNGKALEINSGSLRQITHLKAKRAEREAREVTAADELASKINKLSPVFTLDAGETGKAFGSVTAKDIHDRIVADLKLEDLPKHAVVLEKAIKEKEFKPIPLLRHYVIALNTNRFPFNNPNFRLAILSSINPKEILPKDSKQFSLANAMIPPALFSTKEDTAVSFDPVKANEYLKKSGVIVNKSVKIEFLSGIAEPFASISKKIAEQIEKNINVPVKLLIMSTKEFETYSNLGEYSMMMISWTAKARTAKDFLFPYSGYYSSNNRAKHTNEEYDQAIINNDLGKAQKIISKQTGVIQPLFFEKSGYLSHKTIKNLQFDHIGLPILKDVVLLKK